MFPSQEESWSAILVKKGGKRKIVAAQIERETMNSSSSGSDPKQVETASRLQKSFSRRIPSNKHAISGGAPTWNKGKSDEIESTKARQ